jgi:hypothetical protein
MKIFTTNKMNKDENKKQANVFSNFDHTYTKKKRNFLYLTFTYFVRFNIFL